MLFRYSLCVCFVGMQNAKIIVFKFIDLGAIAARFKPNRGAIPDPSRRDARIAAAKNAARSKPIAARIAARSKLKIKVKIAIQAQNRGKIFTRVGYEIVIANSVLCPWFAINHVIYLMCPHGIIVKYAKITYTSDREICIQYPRLHLHSVSFHFKTKLLTYLIVAHASQHLVTHFNISTFLHTLCTTPAPSEPGV